MGQGRERARARKGEGKQGLVRVTSNNPLALVTGKGQGSARSYIFPFPKEPSKGEWQLARTPNPSKQIGKIFDKKIFN